MNRVRVAALLAAVAVVAAGCTSQEGAGAGETPPGGPPMPRGAGVVSSLPAPEQDQDCTEPERSLSPTRPLPGPGDFEPGSAMAKIRARGKLIVGVDQNNYKFGYRNPVSGRIEGFDIDMATQIAKAIFGDVDDRLQFRVLTSADRVPAVRDGDVDIVVQTMTINCERLRDVSFSAVYYEAGQKVLVKKDSEVTGIESLGGRKVCAARGSTSLATIVNRETDPPIVGIGVDSWTDCLVMLQQNQVDAVSTDDTILAGLRAQDPFTEVRGDAFTKEPYGMAISKDAPEFVRFVNAVLEKVTADGVWVATYDKWLRNLLGTEAAPPVPAYRD